MEDENRIGLTGEVRAAFIKSAIDECNKVSNSATVLFMLRKRHGGQALYQRA